jgi:hypothetical protein
MRQISNKINSLHQILSSILYHHHPHAPPIFLSSPPPRDTHIITARSLSYIEKKKKIKKHQPVKVGTSYRDGISARKGMGMGRMRMMMMIDDDSAL